MATVARDWIFRADLYGRAAFAGAIAYTTKNPKDEVTGNLGVNVAQGNEAELKGALSGSIAEALGYRVAGAVCHEFFWFRGGFL